MLLNPLKDYAPTAVFQQHLQHHRKLAAASYTEATVADLHIQAHHPRWDAAAHRRVLHQLLILIPYKLQAPFFKIVFTQSQIL
uniref:Uncharacterized protein n=1 Tax=Spironucleus salmonicida TaxID=348837 RepID=V6LIA7_9EUKA|eukprot:EST43446.1 Hypothetical protein SS50377_16809 [Spironucleus salmonicida]